MKKINSFNDEIDLGYFISILRKKIHLIVISSLTGSLLFFLYNLNFNNDLKLAVTTVVIKKPLSQKFDVYGDFLYNKDVSQKPLAEIYFVDFQINLISKDNFSKFLDQYPVRQNLNEIESSIFNKYKKSLFTFEEFKAGNKIIPNTYSLKYPKKFDGPNLLNEYILFTNDITIKDFIYNLELNLEYRINQLDIKRKTISNFNLVDNEIENLKILLKSIDKNKLTFNPILDKAAIGSEYSNKKQYIISGLFFGFFLSIFFIFFRLFFFNLK
jgi:hypothetical protein